MTDRVGSAWKSEDPWIRSAITTHAGGDRRRGVRRVSIEESDDEAGDSFEIDQRTVSLGSIRTDRLSALVPSLVVAGDSGHEQLGIVTW